MKVVVQGVNFDLTPSIRRYVDDKLVRTVEKLLSRHPSFDAVMLNLELVKETPHHKKGQIWKVIANLRLPGKQIWQKTSAEDIHAAVDDLEEILKRELTKVKERSRSRELRGARQAKKDLHLSRSARLYRKGRVRNEGN